MERLIKRKLSCYSVAWTKLWQSFYHYIHQWFLCKKTVGDFSKPSSCGNLYQTRLWLAFSKRKSCTGSSRSWTCGFFISQYQELQIQCCWKCSPTFHSLRFNYVTFVLFLKCTFTKHHKLKVSPQIDAWHRSKMVPAWQAESPRR